ncbi:MAG: hypothetical protein IPO83_18115 [Chitinophagaceae bacterium]|nr:hypothetical protein [Chitinophagaceae bacterium]
MDLANVIMNKDVSKSIWCVYSDRDYNTTFESPTGGKKKLEANFMDAFFVIDVQDNYCHIVKCDEGVRDYVRSDPKRYVPVSTVDYGWIEKSKLLMWQSCLFTDPQKIAIKALAVINDPNVILNIQNYVGDDNSIRMFNGPDLAYKNDNVVRLAQFMFIYKETANSYLVGKDMSFEYASRGASILGWVSKGIVRKWSDRICYEPNWDITSAEERRIMAYKVSLFESAEEAKSFYAEGIKTTKAEWNDDNYEIRMMPSVKRFPVLEEKDGVLKTGFVTDVYDSSGKKLLENAEYGQVEKEGYEKIRNQIKNVNIVFVVDGDPSLNDYNQKVVDAIRTSTNMIEEIKSQSQNPVTFGYGAVVYYPNCAGGEANVISNPIVTDPERIIVYLDGKLRLGESCVGTVEKPLYLGLEKGLSLFAGDKKNESNFLVVIGSAGDKDNTEKVTRLVSIMSQTLQGLIAFQVTNGNDIAYDAFVSQLSELIGKTAIKIGNDLRSNKEIQASIKSGGVKITKPSWIQDNKAISRYYLEAGGTGSAISGTIVYSPAKRPMNIELFSSSFDTVIAHVYNETEKGIEDYDANALGFSERGSEISQRFLRWWQRVGGTDEQLKKLSSQMLTANYQIFDEAYFMKNMAGADEPAFKPVLLVSLQELGNIVSLMENFRADGNMTEQRENCYNAFIKLLQFFYGTELSEDDLSQKDWRSGFTVNK